MLYEISKERLLQIASDSPKSKVKVRQWYPDVFDSLPQTNESPSSLQNSSFSWTYVPFDKNGDAVVSGKWYTDDDSYFMIYNEDRNTTGFFDGSWGTHWGFSASVEYCRRARSEEIESRLKDYLKENGYNSVNFNPLGGSEQPNRYGIDAWFYNEYEDTIYTAPGGYGGYIVYEKGVFAELIN